MIRALAVTGQRRVGSHKRQAGRGSCNLSLVSPHCKLLVQRSKVSGQWSASLRVNMHIMAATRQHSQSSPTRTPGWWVKPADAPPPLPGSRRQPDQEGTGHGGSGPWLIPPFSVRRCWSTPKTTETGAPTDGCTHVHSSILTIAKTWAQSEYPSEDKWYTKHSPSTYWSVTQP